MPDELDTAIAPDADTTVPAASTRKKRSPRTSEAGLTATNTTSEPAKKNRGGRPKRAEAASAPSGIRGRRATSTTPVAGRRGPNRSAKSATASSPLADDFSELLQLEEENKRLRQELAQKLRAENAELRSRLGQK